MSSADHTTDVLVVGGGPAGAAVGSRLAAAGHRVTIIEKRPTPRHKSCGDALSPRAVRELAAIGVDPLALGGHRIDGLRVTHGAVAADVPWPDHPDVGRYAVVLRRDLLDGHLRAEAERRGATVLMGHEAIAPIAERGFVRGASVAVSDGGHREIRARFVVVADGANSRFGRGLGTRRRRNWPYAIAARTYFDSPLDDGAWIEAAIGLPDPNGRPIAGYGWVTPMGDGTVNVGVGVLSSHRDIKSLNTLKLLDSFSVERSTAWRFDPAASLKEPTRLRLPMGGSIEPQMGPTFLVVGDAAGAANPFNGDGVDAALMTGRIAAEVIDEALTTGNSTTLQRYPVLIADELERYRKVGRLTARFLGRPAVLRTALRVTAQHPAARGAALRVASNELRDGPAAGGAERAYRLAAIASRFAPSW